MRNRTKAIFRRDFLRLATAASLSIGAALFNKTLKPFIALPNKLHNKTTSARLFIEATKTPIQQCQNIKELSVIPKIKGESYILQVPDTIDLHERAKLALHAMTSCSELNEPYAPYDNFEIWRNPPIMRNKTMFNGKYMEATALLRYLTGNETDSHVDQSWRSLFLEAIINNSYPWWGVDGGRLLAWIGNNYLIEKNPCWRELGKKAVGMLSQGMVYKDNYCYYPNDNGEMPVGWDATWGGWVLQGLSHLYLATNDEETMDLARKLAYFLKSYAKIFDEQAHFLARHPSDKGPALHFHHNGNTLEGLSAYALAANDKDLAAFVQSGYEWARSLGSPLVGFFPEYINDWPDDRSYIDCETCCTADMIMIGMALSEMGQVDYWDDVDHYVRNQFIEMQLMDKKWIDRMTMKLSRTPIKEDEDGYRVSERMLGSFASWASPNDWYIEGTPGTTFCCIGNGARTIYYLWKKMIKNDSGTLYINLLFNHSSPWADILSYLPYEGRVDIIAKKDCELKVRIPEWVKPEEINALVDDEQRKLFFNDRYAQIGYVKEHSKTTITFPIYERSENISIGKKNYKLLIRGNDVLSIKPDGKWYPFYKKMHFSNDEVHWIKRERFVPIM